MVIISPINKYLNYVVNILKINIFRFKLYIKILCTKFNNNTKNIIITYQFHYSLFIKCCVLHLKYFKMYEFINYENHL